MVIELSTAFAMRCADCGYLEIDQLNVFQLSGNQKHSFYCKCGSKKAYIFKKGPRYVNINYYCIICDEEHSIIVPKNKFWSNNKISSITCARSDLNLGYYGSYKLVKEELDRQQQELNSMADELGFDDFDDPELMLDILDYLHDAAAAGDLLCECGSRDIYIDLYSSEIKLTCSSCNTSLIIPATSREHLHDLKNVDEIKLNFSQETSQKPKGPWINI